MPTKKRYVLIAWKEAHKLCLWIYKITEEFPTAERYRLTNQLCKAAASVPTNIAEGNSRRTKKDKSHFLDTALASLEEVHYECKLSCDLGILSYEHFRTADMHIHRISYLLTRLRASLQ